MIMNLRMDLFHPLVSWHPNRRLSLPEVFMLEHYSGKNELFLVILIAGGVNKMEHASYRGVLDQTIHNRVKNAMDGFGQLWGTWFLAL